MIEINGQLIKSQDFENLHTARAQLPPEKKINVRKYNISITM